MKEVIKVKIIHSDTYEDLEDSVNEFISDKKVKYINYAVAADNENWELTSMVVYIDEIETKKLRRKDETLARGRRR